MNQIINRSSLFFPVSRALLACLLTLSPPSHSQSAEHANDQKAAAAPTTMVLLPIKFDMSQLPASGIVEPIPEWSRTVESSLGHALSAWTGTQEKVALLPLPELSAEESALLDEHLALYELVSMAAIANVSKGGSRWKHKQEAFDYGIGPGLDFLREKTGADQALIVNGYQIRPTGGRMATILALALLGVSAPVGQSAMIVGSIDLGTGRITWLAPNTNLGNADLRDQTKASRLVQKLMGNYPQGSFFKKITLAP